MLISEHDFDCHCDMIEATSLRRPDISWRHVDPSGHEHRWHLVGAATPATHYDATEAYEVPTLEWVKTGEDVWPDDDEPHDVGEWRCRQCGSVVERAYTADTHRQYSPGIRYYTIDGVSVTREEFERRLRENWPSHWPPLELPR